MIVTILNDNLSIERLDTKKNLITNILIQKIFKKKKIRQQKIVTTIF